MGFCRQRCRLNKRTALDENQMHVKSSTDTLTHVSGQRSEHLPPVAQAPSRSDHRMHTDRLEGMVAWLNRYVKRALTLS
jgi:hypothetical protein